MASPHRFVRLKPEKEKSLLRRHPWIFSGAIQEIPSDCAPGELLPVLANNGQFLALAYFQPEHSLAGRVLSFSEGPIKEILKKKIDEALKRREPFYTPETNAYRLINAEGDELPGLVVDQYKDVLVMQCTTAGMEHLKNLVVELLLERLRPKAIYEKSHGPARLQEGLKEQEGFIWGDSADEIEILENGLKFIVSLQEGQKSGFFLDQREMRHLIRTLSKDKHVLNGFAYTGGFSIAALKGGAAHVDSVEISRKVEPTLMKNIALNQCDAMKHRFFGEDVFDFLSPPLKRPLHNAASRGKTDPIDEQELKGHEMTAFSKEDQLCRGRLEKYDLIILDPPAFAKKRSDVEAACRGYKQLLGEVFKKARRGTMLLFSSCSHYVDEKLLQMLAFQSAIETGRMVTLLSRHRQAFDHPISLFHPEGEYLKSLLLSIDGP